MDTFAEITGSAMETRVETPPPPKRAKKERALSSLEKEALVEAVAARWAVLRGKLSQQLSAQDKRQKWQEVVKEVNAIGGQNRTLDKIKDRQSKLFSEAKIACLKHKKALSQTGGVAVPPPTPIQERMVAIMGETLVYGIPGAVSSARAVDSPAASEDPAPAEESDDGSGSTEDAVAVTEGPSGDGSASMASSKNFNPAEVTAESLRLQRKTVELLQSLVSAVKKTNELLEKRPVCACYEEPPTVISVSPVIKLTEQ